MAQPAETLVRWYLRFNGYLGVENLVVHEPGSGAVPQGAEFDVVAVRFPYSHEIADFELPRDPRLTAIENPGVVNVLIAEVKGGRDTALNDVWKAAADEQLRLARLGYLVRWLGIYQSDAEIQQAAEDLRRAGTSDRGYFIRVVYFGARHSQQADALKVPQVWNLADPELPGPPEAKVSAILSLALGRAIP